MRRTITALVVVITMVGLAALPVGAGTGEIVDANFIYNDYPDNPDEPDQRLDVFVDENNGVSEFAWNAEFDGVAVPDLYMTGEIACITFIEKAAVLGVHLTDVGEGLPDYFLNSWWLVELIDGGPGYGGDLLISGMSTEAGVYQACASGEHLEVGGGFVENVPTDGNIYVALASNDQVETINVNYQIPRDADEVFEPGILDWGCENGFYILEEGNLHVMAQTKDQGDTVRNRQMATADGILQRYDLIEVDRPEDDGGPYIEYLPTGEYYDLNQDKAKVDLLVDQYTGNPISGSMYMWGDIVDQDGNVVDWVHIDGEFIDGTFEGVMEGTCGF